MTTQNVFPARVVSVKFMPGGEKREYLVSVTMVEDPSHHVIFHLVGTHPDIGDSVQLTYGPENYDMYAVLPDGKQGEKYEKLQRITKVR